MASYRKAVEYIALNDEPSEIIEEVMCGFPSVVAIAVAFGKSVEDVAAAVVDYREKHKVWDRRLGKYVL